MASYNAFVLDDDYNKDQENLFKARVSEMEKATPKPTPAPTPQSSTSFGFGAPPPTPVAEPTPTQSPLAEAPVPDVPIAQAEPPAPAPSPLDAFNSRVAAMEQQYAPAMPEGGPAEQQPEGPTYGPAVPNEPGPMTSLKHGLGSTIEQAGAAANYLIDQSRNSAASIFPETDSAARFGGHVLADQAKQAGKALMDQNPVEAPEFDMRSGKWWRDAVLPQIPNTVAFAVAAAATAGMGTLPAAFMSRSIESAMEASGAEEEAVNRGMSPEEAKKVADKVYVENLALAGSDALQMALTFAKAPKGFKDAVSKNLAGTWGKRGVSAARLLGTMGSEGAEEMVQDAIKDEALGDEVKPNWESGAIGAIGGGFFHGAGQIAEKGIEKAQDVHAGHMFETAQNKIAEARRLGIIPPNMQLDDSSDSPSARLDRALKDGDNAERDDALKDTMAEAERLHADALASIETQRPLLPDITDDERRQGIDNAMLGLMRPYFDRIPTGDLIDNLSDENAERYQDGDPLLTRPDGKIDLVAMELEKRVRDGDPAKLRFAPDASSPEAERGSDQRFADLKAKIGKATDRIDLENLRAEVDDAWNADTIKHHHANELLPLIDAKLREADADTSDITKVGFGDEQDQGDAADQEPSYDIASMDDATLRRFANTPLGVGHSDTVRQATEAAQVEMRRRDAEAATAMDWKPGEEAEFRRGERYPFQRGQVNSFEIINGVPVLSVKAKGIGNVTLLGERLREARRVGDTQDASRQNQTAPVAPVGNPTDELTKTTPETPPAQDRSNLNNDGVTRDRWPEFFDKIKQGLGVKSDKAMTQSQYLNARRTYDHWFDAGKAKQPAPPEPTGQGPQVWGMYDAMKLAYDAGRGETPSTSDSATQKRPWEMTRQEAIEDRNRRLGRHIHTIDSMTDPIATHHTQVVAQAYADGEDVPARVLAEVPDDQLRKAVRSIVVREMNLTPEQLMERAAQDIIEANTDRRFEALRPSATTGQDAPISPTPLTLQQVRLRMQQSDRDADRLERSTAPWKSAGTDNYPGMKQAVQDIEAYLREPEPGKNVPMGSHAERAAETERVAKLLRAYANAAEQTNESDVGGSGADLAAKLRARADRLEQRLAERKAYAEQSHASYKQAIEERPKQLAATAKTLDTLKPKPTSHAVWEGNIMDEGSRFITDGKAILDSAVTGEPKSLMRRPAGSARRANDEMALKLWEPAIAAATTPGTIVGFVPAYSGSTSPLLIDGANGARYWLDADRARMLQSATKFDGVLVPDDPNGIVVFTKKGTPVAITLPLKAAPIEADVDVEEMRRTLGVPNPAPQAPSSTNEVPANAEAPDEASSQEVVQGPAEGGQEGSTDAADEQVQDGDAADGDDLRQVAPLPSDVSEDLYNRAVDVARQNERVSPSLIQRMLKIGYPRAARVMEALEARGVIEAGDGSSRSRAVIQDALPAQTAPDTSLEKTEAPDDAKTLRKAIRSVATREDVAAVQQRLEDAIDAEHISDTQFENLQKALDKASASLLTKETPPTQSTDDTIPATSSDAGGPPEPPSNTPPAPPASEEPDERPNSDRTPLERILSDVRAADREVTLTVEENMLKDGDGDYADLSDAEKTQVQAAIDQRRQEMADAEMDKEARRLERVIESSKGSADIDAINKEIVAALDAGRITRDDADRLAIRSSEVEFDHNAREAEEQKAADAEKTKAEIQKLEGAIDKTTSPEALVRLRNEIAGREDIPQADRDALTTRLGDRMDAIVKDPDLAKKRLEKGSDEYRLRTQLWDDPLFAPSDTREKIANDTQGYHSRDAIAAENPEGWGNAGNEGRPFERSDRMKNLAERVADTGTGVPAKGLEGLGPEDTPEAKSAEALAMAKAAQEGSSKPIVEQWKERANWFVRQLYDRYFDLRYLDRKAGRDKNSGAYAYARVMSGMPAWGERILQLHVMPILNEFKGEEMRSLETVWRLYSEEDRLAVNPGATMPSGLTAGRQRSALKAARKEMGEDLWNRIHKALEDTPSNGGRMGLLEINRKFVLRPLLNAGILDQSGYDKLVKSHKHYLPFQRELYQHGLPEHMLPATEKADLRGPPLTESTETGSDLKLDEPIARWMANIIATQVVVSRNIAAREIAKTAKDAGETVRVVESKSTESLNKREQRRAPDGTPVGVISYYENGKRYDAAVPEVYAEIARGLEQGPATLLVRLASKMSAPLRAGATGLSVSFAVRNWERDMQSMWTREGIKPTDDYYRRGIMAALEGGFRGKENADFDAATKAGVNLSGLVDYGTGRNARDYIQSARDVQGLAAFKQRLGKERAENTAKGITVSPGEDVLLKFAQFYAAAQDAATTAEAGVRPLFRTVTEANAVLERAPRIATYLKAKDEFIAKRDARVRELVDGGMDQSAADAQATQEIPDEMIDLQAAIRARDVTVDFAKSGNFVRVLNMITPFLNARIQGTANVGRQLKDNPKRYIATKAARFAAVSLISMAWNSLYAPDTWHLIPDDDWDKNWIFVLGEGNQEADPKHPGSQNGKYPIVFKIAKGEDAAISTSFVEPILRAAWRKNDRSALDYLFQSAKAIVEAGSPLSSPSSGLLTWGGLGGTIAQTLSPPGITALHGMSSGRDLYLQRDIVPITEQKNLPEDQFDRNTHKSATLVARAFGISPRLLEWGVKAYTATAGDQAMWLLDLGLGAAGYATQAVGLGDEWANPQPIGAEFSRDRSGWERAAAIPGVSGILSVKNSEEDRIGYEKLDKAHEKVQRELYQIPHMRGLGISLGEASDTITLGQSRIPLDLTPAERALYQEKAWEVTKPILETLSKNEQFESAPVWAQKRMVDRLMNRGREAARGDVLETIGRDEVQRRLMLSAEARRR